MVEIPDLSRRQFLLGGVPLAAGGWYLTQPTTRVGGVPARDGPRDQALRPVLGGTWLSSAGIDKWGTLGVGVEYEGDPAVVTNRHVVDDGSDERPEDVVGREVTQPNAEGGVVGTVSAASEIGGAGSSDWAVVGLEDAADWHSFSLGFGQLDTPVDPAAGDRIVVDGAATGLVGGEITRVGVSANFRGELYTDLIEFTVDEDQDTNGNSGGVVATLDGGDTPHPVGLHTFAVDSYRFAIDWGDLPSAVEIQPATTEVPIPDAGPRVEAAVAGRDSGGFRVWVANIGGAAAETLVALLDPDSGDVLDSQSVTLGAQNHEVVRLEAGQPRVLLDAGATEVVVDLS